MSLYLGVISFFVIITFAFLFVGFSKGFKYLNPHFDPCPESSSRRGTLIIIGQNLLSQTSLSSKNDMRKDANDVVFKALEDNYARYFDNIFKATGFIIIAIGWILTSDKSREFLERHNLAYWVLLAGTFLIACGHVVALGYNYISSIKLIQQLREIGYIDCRYFKHYQISYIQICGSVLSDSILFSALITILSLRGQ
ncbi:MAG: hypothetical protein DMF68_01965 [Acidobacteria bacterium]|nr:MAG: hypothetical protein DMF68_01965 [Acidobacteriota bacterium]